MSKSRLSKYLHPVSHDGIPELTRLAIKGGNHIDSPARRIFQRTADILNIPHACRRGKRHEKIQIAVIRLLVASKRPEQSGSSYRK